MVQKNTGSEDYWDGGAVQINHTCLMTYLEIIDIEYHDEICFSQMTMITVCATRNFAL